MSDTPTRGRSLLALVCCALGISGVYADPPAPEPKPSVRFEKDLLYLHKVTDFTPLRVGGGDRDAESEPYYDLAKHAHSFATADLLAAARKDVSRDDLMLKDDARRGDFRFELIRVDGRLKMLKRIGTYPELREAGIAELYEAWVFPTDRDEPVCLHLTDPPAGVEPANDISPMRRVSAAGYFFKVIRYESAEPNPKRKEQGLVRRAPLLVGRSLMVDETPPADTDGGFVVKLIPVVLAGGAALVLVIFGLSVWLRRTDAGTRAYAARRDRNPFADHDSTPPGQPEDNHE